MGDWYDIGAVITGALAFFGIWWYCGAVYGFIGFALGWMPAAILAFIGGIMWLPILILGGMGIAFLLLFIAGK